MTDEDFDSTFYEDLDGPSEVNLSPRFSPKTKELFEALAKAQGDYEKLKKDKKGGFGYYATLGNLIETVREPFQKHGLSFTQALWGSSFITTTIHWGDQYYSATLDYKAYVVAKREGAAIGPHEHGGAQTYARRYALGSLVGLTVTEDDDAQNLQKKVTLSDLKKTRT